MKNLRAIRRVLYITMALNMAAMAAKLGIGYWTGALSLIADGYDSLFDAAGNVVGLVGIYIASRPADTEHPYGHRKFETMTAIVISLLLFLTTWELARSALEHLRHPERIDTTVNVLTFASLAFSIAIHVIVVAYELSAGRRLKSDVLVADAKHTRADIYVSISVIAGLIAVSLGYPIVDPLLALVIAALIAKLGIDIIRESSATLLDGAIVPISEIERIVMGVRDVRSCHQIRSRGHEAAVYVDLHIRVDPALSTAQAHAVAHDVQQRLRAEVPDIQDVVIHVEPEDTSGARTASVIPKLRSLAEEMGLAIHSITTRNTGGGYHVEAHVAIEGTMPLGSAHAMASQLETEAKRQIDRLAEIVTHIEPTEGQEMVPGSHLSADSIAQAICDLVTQTYGPERCHDVQVYPMGDSWAASLHVLLDESIPLTEAHIASSQIEVRLRDAIPRLSHVIVHTEPLSVVERSA